MNAKKNLLLLCTLIVTNLYAQQITGFGLDYAFSLRDSLVDADIVKFLSQVCDQNGDTYVAGELYSDAVDLDPSQEQAYVTCYSHSHCLFLAKYNSNGDFLWFKRFGGEGGTSLGTIDVDSDGNVICSGVFNYSFYYDDNNHNQIVYADHNVGSGYERHGYLLKFDPNGNVLWIKDFSSQSAALIKELELDSNDDIIICGTFEHLLKFNGQFAIDTIYPADNQDDVFLAKFNSAGVYQWAKAIGGNYDDKATGVTFGNNHEVYLIGEIRGLVDLDPSMNTDIVNAIGNGGSSTYCTFISKYNPLGSYEWGYVFPQVNGYFKAEDVIVKSTDNVVLTGSFKNATTSNYDFDPGPGFADLTATTSTSPAFLAEYTSDFVPVVRTTITTGTASGIHMDKDSFDTLYILGRKEDIGGQLDMTISKCSPNGPLNYTKILNGTSTNTAREIALHENSSSFVIVGDLLGSTEFDPGAGSFSLQSGTTSLNIAFMAKYMANGDFGWAQGFGHEFYSGSSHLYDNLSKSIIGDSVGNVYIAGISRSVVDFDPSTNDLFCGDAYNTTFTSFSFVAKYDTVGALQWAFSLDSIEINDKIVMDSEENIYISGYLSGLCDFDPSPTNTFYLEPQVSTDGFIAKYDPNGNLVWAGALQSTHGTSILSIAIDGSDNLIALGYGGNTIDFDMSISDAFLSDTPTRNFMVKYDSNGSHVWSQFMDEQLYTYYRNIDADSSGNIYLASRYWGAQDVDPSSNQFLLSSHGLHDIYLAKYNDMGEFQWVRTFGSTANDRNPFVSVSGSNVYLTGEINGQADFNLLSGLTTLNCSGTFLARLNSDGDLHWVLKLKELPDLMETRSIHSDEYGNVAIGGEVITQWSTFTSPDVPQIDFNPLFTPNPIVAAASPSNNYSGFIAIYDSTGWNKWATTIIGGNRPSPEGVYLHKGGKLSATGSFDYNSDFLPYDSIYRLQAYEAKDIFVTQYFECDVPPFFESQEACGSFTWLNGQTYDSTGIYVDTLVNGDGCRYHAELDLIIHPIDLAVSYVSDSTLFAPNAISYQWISCSDMLPIQGAVNQDYSTDTTGYFAVIVDNGTCVDTSTCYFAGCNVNDVIDSITSCSSYIWTNGQEYSQSGVYYQAMISPGGCSYYNQLQLTILELDTSITYLNDTTILAAGGYIYEWINCEDSTSIAGEISQIFSPTTEGYYAVILYDGSCTDTSNCYFVGCDVSDIFETSVVCDSYTWTNGQEYSQSGQYSQILTTPGGCTYYSYLDLTVNSIDALISQLDDTTLVSSAAESYQWIDCINSVEISGENEQQFVPQANGEYAVINFYQGCSDTSNCFVVDYLALETAHLEDFFVVYPNPSHGPITIQVTPSTFHNIQIKDILGQILINLDSDSETTQIDLSSFPSGTYSIEVLSNNYYCVKRMIIQK